jgi:hypothetical protein
MNPNPKPKTSNFHIHIRTLNYSSLPERRVAPHPIHSNIFGPREADSCRFRGADWRSGDSRVIGLRFMVPMKTSLARAIRSFARRSAHTAPCFWGGGSPLPPFPPPRHARRAYKNKQPITVKRELDPTAFLRLKIPEELRHWKAVGARSRARVASVRQVPPPVAAGKPILFFSQNLHSKPRLQIANFDTAPTTNETYTY